MFDKLIESNSAAADFRDRRKYFVLSTVVVGSLFLIGIVVSIYASDFELGADQFELSTMLAPVDQPQNQPEPPRPKQQSQPNQDKSDLPIRQSNMQRTEESPTDIPPISTKPNTQL